MARPKYRLTEKSFIDDKFLDPETRPIADEDTGERLPLLVEYDGIPGPHMVPVNDEAVAMAKAHPRAYRNPIDDLTIVGTPPKDEPVPELAEVAADDIPSFGKKRK
jgi:hypothetical protein